MRHRLILIVILSIAFLLRIIAVDSAPKGLHADEVSFIINTQALLETGMDEDAHHWPIFFESIKDSKPALYSYLQLPFFALLGPTPTASRLPSIFLGLVSIFLAYELVWYATRRRSWALIMAGVLALSPWHIMNSRSTQEVILSLVFVQAALLTTMSLLQSWYLETKQTWRQVPLKQLTLLFIFSLLAMYSYHSSKLLLMAFYSGVVGWLWLERPSRNRLWKSGLILSSLLLAFGLTATAAITRFNAIGLLSSDIPKIFIFEFTTNATGTTPHTLIRFFYNKPLFYGRLFLQQYFAHFTPNYFFIDGGVTARHIIPAHGLFYLVEAILMGAGLYYFLITKKVRKLFPYWLLFLLASPIAAALTTEDIPSSIRPFSLILPLTFLIVLGFAWMWSLKNRWLRYMLLAVVGVGYIWGFAYFLQQFFVQMPAWQPWSRSRDYAVTAERVAELSDNYDTIIITNDLREMYIYLWQEGEISIRDIQAQPLARYQDTYQIGKYIFNRRHCDFSAATEHSLVVATPQCGTKTDNGFILKETTTFDDGAPAFTLYEYERPL